MKKLLLFCAALGTAGLSFGQVLQSQTFETFNTGNLGTQGGFATYGGSAASYQVAAGNGGKILNITSGTGTGTSQTTTPSRFAWMSGLDTAWNSRTTGNNVLKVSYDFFTGGTMTNSAMGGGIDVIDDQGNYLASITMDASTKTVFGINTVAGTPDLVNLGTGTSNVILPANTWVRLTFAYDAITGNTRFVGPGFDKTTNGNDVYVPSEADFSVQTISSTANTSAVTFGFDNLNISAIASTAVLATEEAAAKAISLEVFPNPTTDFLQVQTPEKIEKVYLYTADGIRMDAQLVDGKVNVSALPKGVYLLGVKTAKTYATKKFIKK